MRRPLLLLPLLAVTACKDPLIGEWEAADEGCGKQRLEVEDGLEGDGTIRLLTADGCVTCTISFELEAEGGGDYSGEVDMGDCSCDGNTDAEVECDLNRAGDEIDCTLDLGACGRFGADFERD